MKYLREFLACLAVLCIGMLSMNAAWSQEGSDDEQVVQPNIDETTQAQIRELQEGLSEAVVEKDVDAILGYLDEDILLTTQDGVKLRTVRKHSGVREYMDRVLTGKEPFMESIRPNVEVEELRVFPGDNTAIAAGSSVDHYVLNSGGNFDLATRWTATLLRDGESWRVTSLHISSNMLDNPIFNAAKSSLYRVGGIALSIGVLIGVLLMKLLSKRGS